MSHNSWNGIGYIKQLTTKEGRKLMKEWNKRLKKSGFKDLEVWNPIGRTASFYNSDSGPSVNELASAIPRDLYAKTEYYMKLDHFRSNIDMDWLPFFVWTETGEVHNKRIIEKFINRLADGESVAAILREVKLPKAKAHRLAKALRLTVNAWSAYEELERYREDVQYIRQALPPGFEAELVKVADLPADYSVAKSKKIDPID